MQLMNCSCFLFIKSEMKTDNVIYFVLIMMVALCAACSSSLGIKDYLKYISNPANGLIKEEKYN